MKKVCLLSMLLLAIFSCTKKRLDNDEESLVQNFLITNWSDITFQKYQGETIPNEINLTFVIKNGKLCYVKKRSFFASFGEQNFSNEGEVNVYYDTKIEQLVIELLNEKGDVHSSGHIDLKRDELIPRLGKQVALREKFNSNINLRLNNNPNYDEWSVRGLFGSRITRASQNEDYTDMTYEHYYVSHTSEDFDEIFIKGFGTNTKVGRIEWSLSESITVKLPKSTSSKTVPSTSNATENIEGNESSEVASDTLEIE